jgi:hypothetical protein
MSANSIVTVFALAFEIFSGGSSRLLLAISANLERL